MLKFYRGEFETHTLNVQVAPEPGMLPKDVPISIITHRPDAEGGQAPDTLLQAGLGSIDKAPARVLWLLGKLGITNVAVLASLPYKQVDPSPARLKELSIKGSQAAVERIAALNSGKLPNVAGESLGFPSVAWGAEENPDVYGRIAGLHPLGFQGRMSPKNFGGGMLHTAFQRDQLDRGSMYVGRRATAQSIGDLISLKSRGKQLSFALGIDLLQTFTKIVANKPDDAQLFFNDDDELFRRQIIQPRLEDAGLGDYAQFIPGSHSTIASHGGARQMLPVMDWFQSGEPQPDYPIAA